MKRKFSSLTALVLCVLFTFSLLSPLAIEAKTIGPRTLYLNQTIKGLTIEPGDLYLFEFTAPETGYYIVETFGSVDTYGKIERNNTTTWDDDSGYGMNCAIGIGIVKGRKVTVEITVSSAATQGGPFSIAVSRQLANIYTFKYPGINGLSTLSDSQIPSQYLTNLGYKVSVRKNMLKSTAIANAQSQNYPWLCTEVFLFAGHGDIGHVIFTNGEQLDRLTSAEMKKDPNEYSMQQTKLAVWASCYSSVIPGGGISIAEAAKDNGADASIGFCISIKNSEATEWTNTFFKHMRAGETVNQALESTTTELKDNDAAKAAYLYGNGSTVIKAKAPNKRIPQDPRSIKEAEEKKVKQIEDIKKNYTQKEKYRWGTFYTKEINGIPTNDYYSISNTDGSIYKSPFLISEQEAAELKNILDKYPEYLERELDIPEFYNGNPECKAVTIEEETYIVKYEGKVFPMKQIDVQYKSSDSEYPFWERYCFNLLDGSTVNYDPTKTD